MVIAAVYLILLLVCTLYSIVLERVRERYIPNWTWLTVVIGNGFVIAAQAAIILNVALTPLEIVGVLVGANVVGGLPVIIWQVWQMMVRYKGRG